MQGRIEAFNPLDKQTDEHNVAANNSEEQN